VLRVGSVADSSFQETWLPERKQRAEEIARTTGRERFAGVGRVSPDLFAGWVVEIATMPREARVGVLEIRPS
jgi:hypothetical protein